MGPLCLGELSWAGRTVAAQKSLFALEKLTELASAPDEFGSKISVTMPRLP